MICLSLSPGSLTTSSVLHYLGTLTSTWGSKLLVSSGVVPKGTHHEIGWQEEKNH